MKSHPSKQLDLLGNPALGANGRKNRPQLVIELDHRTWMRFLSEEWLLPDESGRVILGLNRASGSVAPNLMAVGVWFDQTKLPHSSVMAWREHSWITLPLSDLVSSDTVISWNGPLPLFAVHHFTVNTSEIKAHLLAMVRNFADIEPPTQSIEVGSAAKITAPADGGRFVGTQSPPENWDALRGAASMALWSVPAIGPWLQLLCGSLSNKVATEFAETVHAPWLRSSLWSADAQLASHLPPLWRAMVGEFSRPGALKEWKPRLLLEAICSHALLLGDNEERLTRLIDSTTMLLQDRGTIEELGCADDLLGLVLQLVLLRPSPERFSGWKEDWPAMPPGAWWTGAILVGYLSGFRALPRNLRGSVNARKLLALRTWALSSNGSPSEWSAICKGSINWAVENDAIVIRVGHEVLAEHKFSNRGRWFQADLNNSTYRDEAKAVAEQFCPDLLRQALVLEESDFHLLGTGQAKLDTARMMLKVKGRLEIALGSTARVASQLDVERFRDWLATAPMPHKLSRPIAPLNAEQLTVASSEKPTQVSAKGAKTHTTTKGRTTRVYSSPEVAPKGLSVVPEFISREEEAALLESIDALPWDTTMSRRVQHHGWRYDYKARKVDPAAYIGPLPSWASLLGERLFQHGLLSELPDQVIVNEYIGQQSISKHIDCPSCFRGAVITVSLNESWEMVFSRRTKSGDDEKYKVLLPRRSAAVLDGESRSSWLHEIPRRMTEAGVPRGRRVSITFRKVDTKQ